MAGISVSLFFERLVYRILCLSHLSNETCSLPKKSLSCKQTPPVVLSHWPVGVG